MILRNFQKKKEPEWDAVGGSLKERSFVKEHTR